MSLLKKLKDFLAKNLPFSESRFKSLFEDRIVDGKVIPAEYSKDTPFVHLFDRNQWMLMVICLKVNLLVFRIRLDHLYNPIANVDKKFIGQKDPDVWTVKEKRY